MLVCVKHRHSVAQQDEIREPLYTRGIFKGKAKGPIKKWFFFCIMGPTNSSVNRVHVSERFIEKNYGFVKVFIGY